MRNVVAAVAVATVMFSTSCALVGPDLDELSGQFNEQVLSYGYGELVHYGIEDFYGEDTLHVDMGLNRVSPDEAAEIVHFVRQQLESEGHGDLLQTTTFDFDDQIGNAIIDIDSRIDFRLLESVAKLVAASDQIEQVHFNSDIGYTQVHVPGCADSECVRRIGAEIGAPLDELFAQQVSASTDGRSESDVPHDEGLMLSMGDLEPEGSLDPLHIWISDTRELDYRTLVNDGRLSKHLEAAAAVKEIAGPWIVEAVGGVDPARISLTRPDDDEGASEAEFADAEQRVLEFACADYDIVDVDRRKVDTAVPGTCQ
ncbi:hypothetical protein [Dietzia timorensis]|nr:hypothetical protein [Dietzia timorensis]